MTLRTKGGFYERLRSVIENWNGRYPVRIDINNQLYWIICGNDCPQYTNDYYDESIVKELSENPYLGAICSTNEWEFTVMENIMCGKIDFGHKINQIREQILEDYDFQSTDPLNKLKEKMQCLQSHCSEEKYQNRIKEIAQKSIEEAKEIDTKGKFENSSKIVESTYIKALSLAECEKDSDLI